MGRIGSISWEEHAREIERFLWHFTELAIILMVGMFLLNVTSMTNPLPGGYNYLSRTNPTSYSLTMLGTILVIMVAWMSYRHHPLPQIGEMSLAISLPGLLLVSLASESIISGSFLLVATDLSVWIGMLGAMLYQWNDYSGAHHHLARTLLPQSAALTAGTPITSSHTFDPDGMRLASSHHPPENGSH